MFNLLSLLLGFIASYLFLSRFFKKALHKKYKVIHFKTTNYILENEILFLKKTERISYLKNIINEVSQKISVIRGKNISDKHLYKDKIIENYEFKKSLQNKESADDSEKTGDGTSNNDISKEDKIVLDSDFFSYIT